MNDQQLFKATCQTKSFWFGLGGFIILALGLFIWSDQLTRYLVIKSCPAINKLVVQGAQKRVTVADVQNILIDIVEVNNFFTLNVNKVKTKIQKLPWVRGAIVRKQWPDYLIVQIEEQQPLASWNNQALINTFGEIFAVTSKQSKMSLVNLAGPQNSQQKVLMGYLSLQSLLNEHGFMIRQLTLTKRNAWQLLLKRGLLLKLGQQDYLKLAQRFITVYPLIDRKEYITYLDMRYSNGLAVGWQLG